MSDELKVRHFENKCGEFDENPPSVVNFIAIGWLGFVFVWLFGGKINWRKTMRKSKRRKRCKEKRQRSWNEFKERTFKLMMDMVERKTDDALIVLSSGGKGLDWSSPSDALEDLKRFSGIIRDEIYLRSDPTWVISSSEIKALKKLVGDKVDKFFESKGQNIFGEDAAFNE